jgi:hypothetical protein
VGGQHHAPAALPPGKTRYPLYRRLGGPQCRSGRVRKISPPHRDFLCTIVDLFDLLVARVTNMGQIILLPLPKEGMLWIFPAGKIRRLQSGANARSWVPEASMLTPRPPKPLFDPRTVQPVASRYTD